MENNMIAFDTDTAEMIELQKKSESIMKHMKDDTLSQKEINALMLELQECINLEIELGERVLDACEKE